MATFEEKTMALIHSLSEVNNLYSWYEERLGQQGQAKIVSAIRALAVPNEFDVDMALSILKSKWVGCNGDSTEVFYKLLDLPFIHREMGDIYVYEPDAREYFDEQVRNNGIDYKALNSHIARYYAKRRQDLPWHQRTPEHQQGRFLIFREIYHTIPADPEEGLKALHEFVEQEPEWRQTSDNWSALQICNRQRRFLPADRQIDLWYFEGRYNYFLGDYDSAKPLFERVRRSGQVSSAIAIACHFLGVIYWKNRPPNLIEGEVVLNEARNILEELNDRAGKAMVLNTLGGVYRDRGRDFLPQATEALEEARDIFEEFKDRSSKAMVLNTLGGVYRDRGNLHAAGTALIESLNICEEMRKQDTLATAWNQLGRVYEDRADQEYLEKAIQAYIASRDINRKIGEKHFADKMDQAATRVGKKLQKLISEKK